MEMKATHGQMSRIKRKSHLLDRVLHIRNTGNSILFVRARKGRFNLEGLRKWSDSISRITGIKTEVIMCDDPGERDIEFTGIEVTK